ncbi:ATPase associated with various cellular activities AAA_5 [Candidatus Vecturithrix granuli]|uniref:ATPase associated with various cellular activities AAA_5 n=1 Tax=Vecturithrix granuli TaxID=1499967 RepID=A0A081C6D5_VECG1|nr:ATPase associated with various cellular activities AAA_5 [Candidatus Vecturithrix granuli]
MQEIIRQFAIPERPNYISQRDEEHVFRAAFQSRIPLILKGPTGCGKTRFIEYMAYQLQLPLITVSCHEDLTAGDLVGRYLWKDDETVWYDGPLTLAVRYGGICYLDEIVEARKDTVVIIHSLTDDRRMLYIDKTGEVVRAHPDFMMVLSYNPGYQSIVKDLKPSTKQRFTSLLFDYPGVEVETSIIQSESGLSAEMSRRMAEMGANIRQLKGYGLDEGVSTRLLVYVGRLIQQGLSPYTACLSAISHTLTDDQEIRTSIVDIIKLYFGDFLAEESLKLAAQRENIHTSDEADSQ